ncbi:MAG: triose-phosphate isomerase [Nanohaloarchaea archaeon]|nr:triose-phosphate isomerase [Candidatus Nanohaloarchaea archaeon]
MIIVNLKAYDRAIGKGAREVAEICGKAMKESGEEVIVAPSPEDIPRVSHTDAETFAQHIDPVEPGSKTGSVLAKGVKEAGASGTLINHSERRIEEVGKAVQKARDQELTSVVCAQTPRECEKLSEYRPDYIAFEPPQLIGGDVSVSSAKPEMIEEAVERSEVPVLTGAGIKDQKDVEKSIELGCEGVLVASGVVKAEDVYEEVMDLCRGL